MPLSHPTATPDRIDRRPPTRRSEAEAAGEIPSRHRRPRLSGRRWMAMALVLAGAFHLLLLWALRLPVPHPSPGGVEVNVFLERVVPAHAESGEPPGAPTRPEEETSPPARTISRAAEPPSIPIPRPRLSGVAPRVRTIPPTTLLAPLSPLEATPGGVARRSAPVDARRVQIQRAESLLASRLAELPGAGVPQEPAIGLAAGGGVTVPVPWGGFIPENRKDGVWREERCAGKDADQADKAGEAEARNAQCD